MADGGGCMLSGCGARLSHATDDFPVQEWHAWMLNR